MSRSRSLHHSPRPLHDMGRIAGLAVGLLSVAVALAGDAAAAAPAIRIAVAPFAGDAGSGAVARALTGRFAQRDLDRLIAPDAFVATSSFEPKASEVRLWAYNSAVDAIVVGRVSPLDPDSESGGRIVEAVLRSGHSGAELSRHDVVVPDGADLSGSVEPLAAAILGELGFDAPPVDGRDLQDAESAAPPVSASAVDPDGAGDPGSAGAAAPSGRFASELSRSGFRSDAPIEIQADEAEIIDRQDGRKLIFQRNVRVRQANVTLESVRLEASYRKGESEPRELIAEGDVEIVQDDRRARCDRAVYLREDNRLTCRGHAELVQGCDIVRGESIEFDLAGDQARVNGAASIVIQPEDMEVTECPTVRGPL